MTQTIEPPAPPEDPFANYSVEELRARLRRRDREFRAVRRITEAFRARTSLDELERTALDVAIETVDGTGGTIYLHDPKKNVLIFRYVVGATPEITERLRGMEMPDDKGIAGEVFHAGRGKITHKVWEDQSHNQEVDEKTQFQTESICTVPLKSMGERPLGVLQVLNRQVGVFDEEDLAILEILGTQAASAIETARLFEEARRASVMNLIGDISHDVKNMLTPVVTGTQTLEMMMDAMFEDLDRVLPQLPEERRGELDWAVGGVRDFYKEAVEMVYDGSNDAQERVREIADAIKGIISEPHYEMADFRERAEAVAKVLRLVGDKKGIGIDLSGLPEEMPMELDKKGIYNAVYNLINNAIQAISEHREKGLISLTATYIDFNGTEGVEIRFADDGPGMPEEVRKRMFTPNAISTKAGGTGLGTRIVGNVVEAHHGTIHVESIKDVGTTFVVRFPLRQPGIGGAPAPAAPTPATES